MKKQKINFEKLWGRLCPACGEITEPGEKFCSDVCKAEHKNFLYNVRFASHLVVKGGK